MKGTKGEKSLLLQGLGWVCLKLANKRAEETWQWNLESELFVRTDKDILTMEIYQ